MDQNTPNTREEIPSCITFTVKGDPPNKQQKAHKRTSAALKKELRKVNTEILNSELITSDVSLKVELFTQRIRYVGSGHDHMYIGDLDNLVSGICDALKGLIIVEDRQVKEIHAVKHTIEDDEDTMFKVHIKRLTC